MKISDVSIDRPVFITMMGVAALVLGGLAVARLGVDLFPDITFPLATVTTVYPGAGPEEVESQVTRPLEETLSAINGVDEIRSFSRESASVILVTFKLDSDIRQSISDVRDRVAQIRGMLPRDIRDPVVSRIDPTAAPVLTFSVSSPRTPMETRQIVEDIIQPALTRIEGVGAVTIQGGEVREIRAELDRARLEAVGLTVSQVSQAIGADSFDLPSGRVTVGDREIRLQASGRFRTPEELGEVVLTTSAAGTQIRVRDVAHVVDGTVEVRTITRVNGTPSVTFDVQKQAGTNTIAVVDGVTRSLAGLQARLPRDVRLTRAQDQSRFIRNNIRDLWESLLLGGLLAVVVIFVFMLDWRSTLISAIALPTSVITTFFVMWQMGFTLNMISMMGLSLSIGMLIDDSVVVRENIFRHMEQGEDPVTAARKGTSEIALAVMATTFTIVAVFGPVAFTGGIIGRMLRQFGLTVTAAVLVSLVVSFTFDPMLSARITQQIGQDHHAKLRRHPVFGPLARGFDAMDGAYRRLLRWALGHRKAVFLIATLLFFGSVSLTRLMGTEFMAMGDRGEFTVSLELPAGTSLQATNTATRRVEATLGSVPEVVSVITTVGPDAEVNKATLLVQCTPKAARRRPVSTIVEDVRARLSRVPGLAFSIRETGMMAGSTSATSAMNSAVVLFVRGPDYQELGRIAQRAYDIVQSTRGARDPVISYHPGAPEQRLVIDRTRAGDLGVPFAAVATTLRTALEGDVAAKFRDGDHERDVRVQLQPADRRVPDDLLALTVPTRMPGRTVYVRDVTRTVDSSTPSTIERMNRERQITVSAAVSGRSSGEVIGDVRRRLDQLRLPPGYSFSYGGDAKNMAETFGNLGIAMGLAVIFIYLVLASQFESFVHPFTIMFSLPLAMVGAFALLFLFNMRLGMPAMIGIILLMGLVTKNAILLVDYTNQLRDQGRSLLEALVEGGATRLRPILMTSAAMVLGMLPSAISRADGSEFRAPMSVAVIGGVITSTLLTLVVVPIAYVWIDRLTLRGRRERRERIAREAGRPAAE